MYNYSIVPLFKENFEENLLEIKKQYDENVTDCALFMMTLVPEGNPVIDKVGMLCEIYDKYRDRLLKYGYECGILVQASLGHGYKLDEMFPFQPFVNLSNGESQEICCPYDENFREHFKNVMHTLATHNPKTIMLDDDFCLLYNGGCGCPLHTKKISDFILNNITREEIYKHAKRSIESYDFVRNVFIEKQGDALIGAVEKMREGIDEVNPNIQGAYCTVGIECEFAGEIAKKFAGKNNPSIVRINNSRYHAEGSHYFTNSFLSAATQINILKSEGVDIILAETDTCPQNRYSTGAQSLHTHFTGTLLEGANGAKHWITRMHTFEPISGEAYRKILSENHGFYKKIAEIAEVLEPVGCRIPLSNKRIFFFDNENRYETKEFGWSGCVLERLGLPLYYSSKNGGAVFMSEQTDLKFTDDEIKNILSKTVFLSSDVLERINKRGFGEYTGVQTAEWNGESLSGEIIKDTGFKVPLQVETKMLIPVNESVTEDSYVYHLSRGKDKKHLFPAVTVFENSLGGKVICFCGVPKAEYHYTKAFSFLCDARKQQLIRLLKENNCMPVYYTKDSEVLLRAGYLPDKTLVCILFNLSYDIMEEIPLYILDDFESIKMLQKNGELKNVEFEKNNEEVTVKEKCYPLNPVVLYIK